MYVCIDISERDTISFTFFSHEYEKRLTYVRSHREILLSFEEALKQQRLDVEGIEGIAVVLGCGGFTGTRLATTLANTFSYVRGIPIIGVTAHDAQQCASMVARFAKTSGGIYLSAQYSGEPHIGSPT